MGKPVKGAKILVLGVTYKSDVGDLRESPALKVMTALHRRGASVSFHDPFVDAVTMNGSVLPRTELAQRPIATADCVALLTPHSTYDLEWVADHAPLIFDARNAFGTRTGCERGPLTEETLPPQWARSCCGVRGRGASWRHPRPATSTAVAPPGRRCGSCSRNRPGSRSGFRPLQGEAPGGGRAPDADVAFTTSSARVGTRDPSMDD